MTSHIFKNLKTFRQAKHWSQGEFAKRLKISIPAYSKIETWVTDVNTSRLYQIAAVLGIDVIYIISKTGESPNFISEVEFRENKAKLLEAQEQISKLQAKVIMLYEEGRELNNSKQPIA